MTITFILITTLRTFNLIRFPIFSPYRAVNTLRFGHGNRPYKEIITVCSDSHTKQMNTHCGENVGFLDAFAKFPKSATISFVMSASPSAWNNSATTARIFVNFDT